MAANDDPKGGAPVDPNERTLDDPAQANTAVGAPLAQTFVSEPHPGAKRENATTPSRVVVDRVRAPASEAPDTAPPTATPDTVPDTPPPEAERVDAPLTPVQPQSEDIPLDSLQSPPSEVPETEPSPLAKGSSILDPAFLISTLLMAASLVMVLWNLQDSSLDNANTGSRYATIESLVDYGTFTIDQSQYRNTIDKVKVGEHFLSSKPPTMPTAAAGVYWVYQKLTGRTLATHEGPVVWFISLSTGWTFHLVFLIYFYRFCRLLLKRQLALIASVAAACFSYLGVAYATAINNHSLGASLLLVGLYYAYRIRNQHQAKLRHWFVAGLVFGILPAIDLPSGAFIPFVLAYLGTYDLRRTLTCFLPMLLPGALIHFSLGYATTGSLVPTYFNSELKNFAGNYFKGKQTGIDALREPKTLYTFNLLLGHHGLFSMTPLFFFGAWEIIRCLRVRVRMAETLAWFIPFLIVLGFYIFRTRNYGGWCVGMRHLVPLMPLLLLYFALWLDRVRLTRTLWAAVVLAFSVGAFHVQDGLTSPFQFSVWHNWLENQPNRGRVGKKMNVPKKTKKPPAHPRGAKRERSDSARGKPTKSRP